MSHERPVSLLRAWVLLARVRLILWLLPWPSAERALVRLNAPRARTPEPPALQLRWAVLAASRFIPASTCLAQAVALQILLTRAGRHSDLRLGIASSSTDGVTAHAWLEYDGRVLIGERQETYVPLPLERPLLGRSKASAISSYDRQRAS